MENKHRRMFSKFVLFIFAMIAFVSGVNATTGPIVKSNYRLYYDSDSKTIKKMDLDSYPANSFFINKHPINHMYVIQELMFLVRKVFHADMFSLIL